MRTLFFFAVLPVFALDNGVSYKDLSGSPQSGRSIKHLRSFARDEICGFPRAYEGATPLRDWQSNVWTRWPASARCPSGSVQQAHVWVKIDLAAGRSKSIHWRDDPSSSCAVSGVVKTPRECDALAPGQAAMLGWNGGDWGCKMTLAPVPASAGATPHSVDCKAMLAAAKWRFRLKGPHYNEIVVENQSPNRSDDFGWANNYAVALRGDWETPVKVYGVSHWAPLVAKGLYLAVANTDPGANYNVGRVKSVDAAAQTLIMDSADEDGSPRCVWPACQHPWYVVRMVYRKTGKWITAMTSPDMSNQGPQSFTLNSTAGISVGDRLQAGLNRIKVASISGNTVIAARNGGGGRQYAQWDGQSATQNLGSGLGTFLPVIDLDTVGDYWVDALDEVHKPLHPWFVLTFSTGTAAVGIEYGVDNTWADRRSNQEYNISYYRGRSGTTLVAARPGVIHVPQQINLYPDGPDVGRFTGQVADRKVWDGAPPGALNVDHNLAYMRYAGIVPNDPLVTPTQQTVDDLLTVGDVYTGSTPDLAWNRGTKCAIETAASMNSGTGLGTPEFRGLYHVDIPGAGGRWQLGLYAYPGAAALYLMSLPNLSNAARWQEVLLGQAACQEHVPIHWRDGDPTGRLKYCNGGAWALCPGCKSCTPANQPSPAFGRPWSVDAHPGNLLPQSSFHGRAPNTSILTDPWNTGIASLNLWSIVSGDTMSHMPQPSIIPWLLTGDFRYERVLISQGHYAQTATGYSAHDPVSAGDNYFFGAHRYRLNDWGFSYQGNGERAPIWQLRDLALGALAARDGSPEKEKLTHAVELQMYIRAGWWNITNPVVYKDPCPAGKTCTDMDSPWLFGRRRLGNNVNNGEIAPWQMTQPGCSGYPEDSSAPCLSAYCRLGNSPWMWNYGTNLLAWLENLGFNSVAPIRKKQSEALVKLLTHPAMVKPWWVGGYRGVLTPTHPEGMAAPTPCAEESYTYGDGKSASFLDVANIARSLSPNALRLTGWDEANSSNQIGGFVVILRAAVMFGTDRVHIPFPSAPGGALTEKKAQDLIKRTMKYQDLSRAPHWAYSPNYNTRIDKIEVDAGSTSAAISFVPPEYAKACSYALNPDSTLDAGDTPVRAPVGGQAVKLDLPSLAAKTSYNLRITCGYARSSTSFTTKP